MKNYKYFIYIVSMTLGIFFSAGAAVNFAHADLSPAGCTGSGLNISLTVNNPQVHIGDVVSYSVSVFNGLANSSGPIVCDASGITASVTTPDGQVHPITLLRTTLSNGQIDSYPNIVTYTARAQDVIGGALAATAIDSGAIHQNDVNSVGGGNQGLNVTVVVPATTLHVIKLVVNSGSSTAVASNFNIHVKSAGADIVGSPAPGTAAPGTLYTLSASSTYVLSEDASSSFVESFSGACDSSGNVTLIAGTDQTCTITNTGVVVSVPPVVVAPPSSGGGGGGNGGNGGGGIGCANCGSPSIVTTVVATQVIVPFTPPVVSVAAPMTPTFPDTGKGGEASRNIAVLIISALIFIGAAYTLRTRFQPQY